MRVDPEAFRSRRQNVQRDVVHRCKSRIFRRRPPRSIREEPLSLEVISAASSNSRSSIGQVRRELDGFDRRCPRVFHPNKQRNSCRPKAIDEFLRQARVLPLLGPAHDRQRRDVGSDDDTEQPARGRDDSEGVADGHRSLQRCVLVRAHPRDVALHRAVRAFGVDYAEDGRKRLCARNDE